MEEDNSYYTSKLNWESPHYLALIATKNSKNLLDLGCAGGELTKKLSLSNKKIIHAYGPMKKVVIMDAKKAIERIERTAKLKVTSIKRI